ncbi:MAG: hypothetical protein HGA85_07485, partial [Nanoarchaeota archaeon]|nr:hypothetical protein [Nanoarchaeota archaeon]
MTNSFPAEENIVTEGLAYLLHGTPFLSRTGQEHRFGTHIEASINPMAIRSICEGKYDNAVVSSLRIGYFKERPDDLIAEMNLNESDADRGLVKELLAGMHGHLVLFASHPEINRRFGSIDVPEFKYVPDGQFQTRFPRY